MPTIASCAVLLAGCASLLVDLCQRWTWAVVAIAAGCLALSLAPRGRA